MIIIFFHISCFLPEINRDNVVKTIVQEKTSTVVLFSALGTLKLLMRDPNYEHSVPQNQQFVFWGARPNLK